MTKSSHTNVRRLLCLLLLGAAPHLTGCLAAAAGVGAEAGYVASQKDRTAKETLEDQYIVSSVKTKFLADQSVPGMDINVDSFRGVVTLRGALKSQQQIDTAINIANETSGVKGVHSQLVLVR